MLLSQLTGCREGTFLGALCAPSPGRGPSVLSLLAVFQVTNPGRSRWPRCCTSVGLCSSLPALESDSQKSNFSPCLSLIYISKFPQHAGCVSRWLPLVFFSLPFSLGWWQQPWVKITLGLITVWSCKSGFLKAFETWAVLSHSFSCVFPCEYFRFCVL